MGHTPPISGIPRRPRGVCYCLAMRRVLATSFLFLATTGCAHVGPALGAVMARVSVGDVIKCADQPTIKAKAICLGVKLLTPAADAALDKAASLAHRAIDAESGSGSSADDLSETDRRHLAADLDRAMDELAIELAAAN